MTARLLSFDTSTERLCIAFSDGEQTFCHESAGGAQASAQLIPQALALLERAASSLAALDAIAYGRGPGAFTGLRTACAVAQGLAFGAGKPVIGIDSLMLVAESVREAVGGHLVWVAMDARMGEIYAAAYRPLASRPGRWEVVEAPALYSLDAFVERIGRATRALESSVVLVGSAWAAFGDRLPRGAGRLVESGAFAAVVTTDPADGDGPGRPSPRTVALARLAQALWEDGAGDDAAMALPLYLRDKVAQTASERAALRAGVAPFAAGGAAAR